MYVRGLRIIAIALCIVAFPKSNEAALLYFDPPEQLVHRGDTVSVAVRLDTDEDECVNTIDATIAYDSDIRAVDVSRGNSILSLWVEEPVIDENEHTVHFAGGIPGGYCGRIAGDPSLTNVVAELLFRLPGLRVGSKDDDGVAHVRFTDASQVLLHDGLGTRADLRFQDAILTLSDTPGQSLQDEWTLRVADDTIPPAPFSIELSSLDTAFSGKYFVVFNTLDKQSGIDHYEIMEEPFEEFDLFKWGGVDAPWIPATSPYVLKDQTLNSTIRVKAIDKAGNETITVFVPDKAIRSLSIERMLTLATVGVTVLVLLFLVGYGIYRRRKQLLTSEDNPHEHESNS